MANKNSQRKRGHSPGAQSENNKTKRGKSKLTTSRNTSKPRVKKAGPAPSIPKDLKRQQKLDAQTSWALDLDDQGGKSSFEDFPIIENEASKVSTTLELENMSIVHSEPTESRDFRQQRSSPATEAKDHKVQTPSENSDSARAKKVQQPELENPDEELPDGIELLKLMKAWPGADGDTAPQKMDIARAYSIWNPVLIVRRLDAALDHVFGASFAYEYRILQRIERGVFNPARAVEYILKERGISWTDHDGKLVLRGNDVRMIEHTAKRERNSGEEAHSKTRDATGTEEGFKSDKDFLATPQTGMSLLLNPANTIFGEKASFTTPPTPSKEQQAVNKPSPLETKIVKSAINAAAAVTMLELVQEERRLRKEWRMQNTRQLRSAKKET